MDFFTCCLYLLAALIAAVFLQRANDILKKYLPGPVGLPLVGRLPFLFFKTFMHQNDNLVTAIIEDARRHGDAAFLRVGMRPIVVLTSYEAIQEALVKQGEDFADRPNFYLEKRKVDVIQPDGKKDKEMGGIFASNGAIWREHRRFALRVMRNLGMGKNSAETKIQIECQGLIEEISRCSHKPFNPFMHSSKAVSNIISQMVFGERLAYEDPDFEKQVDLLYKINALFSNSGMMWPVFFPFLRCAFYDKFTLVDEYNKVEGDFFDFIASRIKPIKERYDVNDEPNNFVEAFLQEEHKLKKSGDRNLAIYSQQQLVLVVADLFDAGTSTSGTLLDWFILYLSKYPDWQLQLREELDAVFGDSQNVSYADRVRCPKTMAFQEEMHRHMNLVPHNVDKAAVRQTSFRGCKIEENSFIIADLKSVHYDPKLWRDPHAFDPTRFLSESGEFKASKYVNPFSVGKRACTGESLAKMELFMFMASIVRAFEVDMDDETKKNSDEVFAGVDGTLHTPLEHKIIFKKRFSD